MRHRQLAKQLAQQPTLTLRKLLPLPALTALTLGCSPPANDQATTEEMDPRQAQILANLRYELPQLERLNPSMGAIGRSSIPGLDSGSIIMRVGREMQQQPFLVTHDDKKLYLVASGPIDVSRSSEEIATLAADKAQEIEEQLLAASEGQPVRGDPDAPITIVEFADFQCPYCASASETITEVLAKYPEDVKLVFLHLPLSNHPWARPAAIAATCAAEQEPSVFWELHDYYFANQRQIRPDNVLAKSREFLSQTSIDLAAWSTCAEDASSPSYLSAASQISRTAGLGTELGVTGTPGFFVNGRLLSGAQPLSEFERVIREAKESAGTR
jgi:protein-disulfide isomerase